MNEPHLRATDLPGWLAPARVSDIPDTKGSFGWVPAKAIAVDDELNLHADGLTNPSPSPEATAPVVLLAWHDDGLALWAPPTAYNEFLETIARPPLYRGGETLWKPIAAKLTDEQAARIARIPIGALPGRDRTASGPTGDDLFIVDRATAEISTGPVPDDGTGEEGAEPFDDFRLTVHGHDGRRVAINPVRLVFKPAQVAMFAELFRSANALYRDSETHHARVEGEADTR